MLPCFLGNCLSRLLTNISRAFIIIGRVSAGSITISIVPCDAATYGLANSDDPDALKKQLVDEFTEKFANPYVAASHGTVDTVIDPAETRPMIIKALEMLTNKRDKQLPRKHGNINL